MTERKNRYTIHEATAYVLDEQLLFAESFASLLRNKNHFQHIFQSNQENEMWNLLQSHPLSHLFLDPGFAGANITTMLSRIQRIRPAIHVIVVCNTENIFVTRQLINSDASGIISKRTGHREIDTCLHVIRSGKKFIANDIRQLLNTSTGSGRPFRFTNMELRVLQFIAKGYSIAETAAAMCLSKHTIVAHRRKLMSKTGYKNASGLVRFAFETGLISQ